jgi:hypothetical protein
LDMIPPRGIDIDPERAAARLAGLGDVQRRDLTTSSGAGGSFVPPAAPQIIRDHFATALRAKGVLASVLTVEPLPQFGISVASPRLSTGTATLVQTGDNIAVQETDLVEANVSSPVITISGQQDLSNQLWDRGEGLDVVLARDLGEDFGSKLDVQIVSGTGANGQVRGLLNIVGVTSVPKTNASPTGATNLAAIGDLVSQTATAYGSLPSHLFMHPRRFSFVVSKVGYNPRFPVDNVVTVPALPVTLGASTSEDRVIAVSADEIRLFAANPVFSAYPQVLSGNLTVRFTVHAYAALLAGRKPAGIGVLSGSEVAAPTF